MTYTYVDMNFEIEFTLNGRPDYSKISKIIEGAADEWYDDEGSGDAWGYPLTAWMNEQLWLRGYAATITRFEED